MKGIGLKRRGLVIGSLSREGCYQLRDEFLGDAPAPLQTPRFCYQGPGTLVLDQTDGEFSIVGGELMFPAQGTPVWGDQDFYALNQNGQPFARALGRVLKWRAIVRTFLATEWGVGWNPNNNPTTPWTFDHSIQTITTTIRCRTAGDVAQNLRDAWPAPFEYAQCAIVLSPYDVNGLHWYPGAADGGYGAHFFFRDESGDDSWRLIWYRQLRNTATVYPAFSNWSLAGAMDYARIPCFTLEDPLLTPIAWDEFTDNNGVTLPNHTMTYGGLTWVNASGVWQITGNEAQPDNGANTVGYVPTATPDCWVESEIYQATAGVFGGFVLRCSADTAGGSNRWLFVTTITPGADVFIQEINDGAGVNRVSVDTDLFAAGNWYNLRARLDDEQITYYVDYGEVAHYATGWFNKHATWHGYFSNTHINSRYDNFIILPRGTGLTRIAYDSFTDANGTSLDAHAMDEGGLAWVEVLGDWDIQVNEARTTAVDHSHAYATSGVSDCWVTGRVFLPAAPPVAEGLLLRKSVDTGGGSNLWYFTMIAAVAGNDTYLIEYDDGGLTVRASADNDWAANARYYMVAECEGDDITCYVDGTQVLQFLAATFNETATWHGIYARNGDVNARWDQFRVTEIPALGEYDAALDSF